MAEQSKFVTGIIDLLTPLGAVTAKPMFGGYGLFLDGAMFALVPKNEKLFLKADAENRDAFIAEGSETHGKMPYYSAPPGSLASWQKMEPWVQGAVAASRRGKKK